MNTQISYEEAHRLFRYDTETGKLYRKVAPSRKPFLVGDEAGTIRIDCKTPSLKYRSVEVDGKTYKVHRIVWLMSYGSWPNNQVDHINGNGLDNRILNLRDVPQTVNARNTVMRKDNTSGHTGVYFMKSKSRWCAVASMNGKNVRLGLFQNIEDAVSARKSYCDNRGFTERHGAHKAQQEAQA